MNASIIIRVKNERKNLEKLFAILKNQTYQDFEIIVVSNNSTDGSEKIVYNYFPKDRIQIVNISNFSYPQACNMGAERAKGKYLVYLSAHSYPISNAWLSDGLSNLTNGKVAGVFAFPRSGPEASLTEKILYGIPNRVRVKKGGHLQNTGSIIRRSIWEKHKFDESLNISEDYEWSIFWEKKGYSVINDPRFAVYHSHQLGILGIVKQAISWQKSRLLINKKFKN